MDEALKQAAHKAWEEQLAWEVSHAAAGGVPYTWEVRQRAVCQRVCVAVGFIAPEGLRHFPAGVHDAVEEERPAWPS